jgi:hypothetical protein
VSCDSAKARGSFGCCAQYRLELEKQKMAAKILFPSASKMAQAIRKHSFAIVQETQSTPPEA